MRFWLVLRAALPMLVCLLSTGSVRPARAAGVEEPPSFRSGSWLGACDNLRVCVEYGFSDDDVATLILSRPPDGVVSGVLILRPERPLRGQVVHLQAARRGPMLSLHPPAGSGALRIALDGQAIGALLPMLRGGSRLAVVATGRPTARPTPLGSFRLAGVAPVQDWIARMQRRRPARAPAPVLVATRGPIGRAPPGFVTGLAAVRACVRADAEQPGEGASGYALSAEFVLWQLPCGSGNFDRSSLFVIADLRTRIAVPASFPVPPQYPAVAGQAPGTLVNVDVGGGGAVLTATEPSRGLDDCGDVRRYRWDGARYRLSLARLMTACHGLTTEDWPIVYRDGGAE